MKLRKVGNLVRRAMCWGLVAVSTGIGGRACGELYINEIFFDPGGDGTDARDEYIEIRGTPSMTLENHYLIFIENEDNIAVTGEAGTIENIFDFNIADNGAVASLGANGFLTLRQKFNRYADPAPGTTDLVNDGPNLPGPDSPGFGDGPNSTIGASDLLTGGSADGVGDEGEGRIENSGFTAMLIHNISGEAPQLGFDLDEGNDGLDLPTGREGWAILDAIGVFSEFSEARFGRLYAPVNFGPEESENLEPGAQYFSTGYEIEYLGRWGNSTGQTVGDWHASNLTDNFGSGSFGVPSSEDGTPDFRQSCLDNPTNCHPATDGNPDTPAPPITPVESNKDVPYGTKLTTTLGAPNYLTGDYNKNGVVDAADYTVYIDSIGQPGSETAHPAADGNHDFVVNGDDYAIFVAAFGQPGSSSSQAASLAPAATPEPGAMLLALVAGGACLAARRPRRGS